jgi:hypothetical protein
VTGGWSSPVPADRYIPQSAEVLQPETIQNISLELTEFQASGFYCFS